MLSPSTIYPNIHKDPFDRLLVVQAKTEGIVLLTSDDLIWKSGSKSLMDGPGPARARGNLCLPCADGYDHVARRRLNYDYKKFGIRSMSDGWRDHFVKGNMFNAPKLDFGCAW